DPSTEVRPDFAGDLYAEIRADLITATGRTEQEVVDCLIETWDAGHQECVHDWTELQEAEALAAAEANRALCAQEDEERIQRETEAEKERAEADKKKPKMNGFDESTAVGDFLSPCPAQYAIQKLTNYKFVELWYFSLDGCREALKSSRSIAENDLGLTRIDDQLTIRPASAFKGSKAALADHELPFSTFLRAKNLYLVQISKAKW
ncbi:hypothetical protein BDR03DRAFT_817940, partial [Suillus americanus]